MGSLYTWVGYVSYVCVESRNVDEVFNESILVYNCHTNYRPIVEMVIVFSSSFDILRLGQQILN